MSIIIPGFRFSSSVRAIERNGTPPYAKMITERTGRDPDASGERRRCVAEDILNELAEEDDWHRERERYPEPPPEHPLVTRVIGGPRDLVLSLVNVRAVVVVVFVPQHGRG